MLVQVAFHFVAKHFALLKMFTKSKHEVYQEIGIMKFIENWNLINDFVSDVIVPLHIAIAW